ncbi:MAG: hypothetical protein WAP74_02400 [Patescibacteria group bacterium]
MRAGKSQEVPVVIRLGPILLPETSVYIAFSDLPIYTPLELDVEIEQRFEEAQAKREAAGRPRFTRGSLASMRQFHYIPGSDHLAIKVAQTDYGKFIGSAHLDLAATWGMDALHTSVAICSHIVTGDNFALFHLRGEIAYPGCIHVIGGMLPFRLEDGSHQHVFGAMKDEIFSELNINEAAICDMYCIGIASDQNPGRLNNELLFWTSLNMTLAEVVESHGRSERPDKTEGDLMPVLNEPKPLADFLSRRAGRFVPTGWACSLLAGRIKFEPDWMPEITKT